MATSRSGWLSFVPQIPLRVGFCPLGLLASTIPYPDIKTCVFLKLMREGKKKEFATKIKFKTSKCIVMRIYLCWLTGWKGLSRHGNGILEVGYPGITELLGEGYGRWGVAIPLSGVRWGMLWRGICCRKYLGKIGVLGAIDRESDLQISHI